MFAHTFGLLERAAAELGRVKDDRKGVTALEYGLLAGLIAGVIIVAVTSVGTAISGVFTSVATAITGAA